MGYRIKEVRESRGITQEELAKKSGVSRGTIVALENGSAEHTTTKTLYKLSQALGVPISKIFFE